MRFRAQPWVPTAGLALFCALAIWGIFAYRNRNPWTPAELVRALPRENAVLFYADVSAIRNASLLQTIVGTKSVEELDYRKFVNESGFDYKTDLDRFVISFQQKGRYAVAVGRFNWPKIKSYAIQSGAQCFNAVCELKGQPLENSTSFYPLQGSAMALASTPNSGGAYLIARTPPVAKASDPWPSNAPVWIWVPGSVWRDRASLPTGARIFGTALGAADSTLFTIEPTEDTTHLALKMKVSCANSADAAKIHAQLLEATALLGKMISRDGLNPGPGDLASLLANGKFRLDGEKQIVGEWPLNVALIQAIAQGSVD